MKKWQVGHSKATWSIQEEKTGSNAAVDAVFIAITKRSSDTPHSPIMLFQPVVDPRPEAINQHQLIDVLIQAFFFCILIF